MDFSIITIIKIIAIIYICIIDIILGLIVSILLDKYLFEKIFKDNKSEDNYDKQNIFNKYYFYKIIKLGFIIGILVAFSYILRNIIQLIPFPLDNYYGFNYDKLLEYKSNTLLTTIIMLYSKTLQNNIKQIKKDLNYND
jgi:hypothetical protein